MNQDVNKILDNLANEVANYAKIVAVLKEENERLKTENEMLKKENEKLKGNLNAE